MRKSFCHTVVSLRSNRTFIGILFVSITFVHWISASVTINHGRGSILIKVGRHRRLLIVHVRVRIRMRSSLLLHDMTHCIILFWVFLIFLCFLITCLALIFRIFSGVWWTSSTCDTNKISWALVMIQLCNLWWLIRQVWFIYNRLVL